MDLRDLRWAIEATADHNRREAEALAKIGKG